MSRGQSAANARERAGGADSGPVRRWGKGVSLPADFGGHPGGAVTKGLSHTHQGTIVPRCQAYKLLKAMELVGPPGLEPGTKGL